MARSGWNSLSDTYRRRLERAGISQAQYESGESLESARGHKHTPERPERAEKNPEKYKDYLANRNRLEKAVTAKKHGIFGESHKFRASRANKNVKKNPMTGKEVPLADLRLAAAADENQWLEWLAEDRERWGFLFYH